MDYIFKLLTPHEYAERIKEKERNLEEESFNTVVRDVANAINNLERLVATKPLYLQETINKVYDHFFKEGFLVLIAEGSDKNTVYEITPILDEE